MSTPAFLGEPEVRHLVEDAPALASPTWLPLGTEWPELEDLAVAHRRLLARRGEVASLSAALPHQFEQEDKDHRDAMAASFAAEGPATDERTPPEERKAALAEADEQLRAANDALDRFVREAVALIEAHVDGWIGDLATRRDGAAEKRREAERLLAEARADEVGVAQLEEWAKRNAGVHERASRRNIPAMRFVTWDSQQAFTPPPEPEADGRPQLVDPPSMVPWDAEQQARRKAAEQRGREREMEKHPERFLPEGVPAPTSVPAAYNEENFK